IYRDFLSYDIELASGSIYVRARCPFVSSDTCLRPASDNMLQQTLEGVDGSA
ncbi:hypothetical protein GGH92_008726, partial [Coemansia sp. RSA 2673]